MFDEHVDLSAPLPARPFDEAWQMRTLNYEKWLQLPDTLRLYERHAPTSCILHVKARNRSVT